MSVIYTIGHSIRSIEEFIALLKAHHIKTLVDIRSIPKSRRCPQFNQEKLKKSLKQVKISYRHLTDLGGLRHAKKDSVNIGWINASFRGYADYMQTPAFSQGLEKLEKIAIKKPTAIMCAEAVPWRCHRSLVADALTVHKWKVFHIQSKKTAKRHKRTAFLKVRRGVLTYP
ncbi:MAG TPA: DUF488 domain-containing protein [Chlamydiales bacterium]|nr:DUF488 domain-containing protein [Chlamydiales bacterium]